MKAYDVFNGDAVGLCALVQLRLAKENLGIYINYNGYGATLEYLHFKPDEL